MKVIYFTIPKLSKDFKDKKNYISYYMKLSLLLFVIGILFVVSGYIQDLDPQCKDKTEVRIIPRNVYDQLVEDATL